MEATVRRPLAALILAAGVSSRMERFKPMLPVGEDTMIRRTVRMMQQAGADLPKLAVMPWCRTDVLELLAATAEMADLHPETPVITMSMGTLGAVSRLAGEAFGSAMTFANPGQASAPGQVSLDIVNEVLNALHL